MSDIEYRLADLINFSSAEKPVDFEQAFKGIIHDKLEFAINNKKQEVARSIFPTDENEDYRYNGQAA